MAKTRLGAAVQFVAALRKRGRISKPRPEEAILKGRKGGRLRPRTSITRRV